MLLLIAMVAVAAALVPAAPAVAEPHCAEGWKFTNIKKKRVRMLVTERRRIENRTNRTAKVTFESKRAKTVKLSASLKIEASYNAIFTSVKAEVDVGVEKSVTSEVGESVEYPLRPKRAAHGRHGVFIRPVTGRLTLGDHSSQCRVDKRITAYLPRESGWRISVSKL
jgi:hypothetical protein